MCARDFRFEPCARSLAGFIYCAPAFRHNTFQAVRIGERQQGAAVFEDTRDRYTIAVGDKRGQLRAPFAERRQSPIAAILKQQIERNERDRETVFWRFSAKASAPQQVVKRLDPSIAGDGLAVE
jgi:hypothetical protein